MVEEKSLEESASASSSSLSSSSVSLDKLNTNNIMDVYLKKHSLDLKVIPNRNMIKLSDLRSKSFLSSPPQIEDKVELETTEEEEDEEEDDDEEDEYDGVDEEEEGEDEDEGEDEEEDEGEDENIEKINRKKMRKKREPSLKLQQKLTSQDLELIVSSVKSKQARVFIADVVKTGYVDKILRIELLSSSAQEAVGSDESIKNASLVLSNGRSEALLKKSMFGKELATLFDAFVGALCGQESVRDERSGTLKPILKCLVECCGFKSISEAEINRHIKRFLY